MAKERPASYSHINAQAGLTKSSPYVRIMICFSFSFWRFCESQSAKTFIDAQSTSLSPTFASIGKYFIKKSIASKLTL